MPGRPSIALISTGGTIDSLGHDRTDLAFYTEARSRLPEGELLSAVPEIAEVADIEPIPFDRVPSYQLSVQSWARLAQTVRQLIGESPRDGS